MDNYGKSLPKGFDSPLELPDTDDAGEAWQAQNRNWWEEHPMRYDFTSPVRQTPFTRPFYEEIDRRFFGSAYHYMPWRVTPFERLIDFDGLGDKDVLEIGVGNGSHAALLASHARSFTGIDLTGYAVKSTTTRFELYGLNGRVMQMDAERMTFPDNSFDFIWSWGVLHHSANTSSAIREASRVLRPGGQAVTMVYYRNWWNYYLINGLVQGVLRGGLWRYGSLHRVVQHHIDGAIARHYSVQEWKRLASPYLRVESTWICGQKSELFPIPASRVKSALMQATPDSLGRFFTNTLRMGYFLVANMKKDGVPNLVGH